MTKNVKINEILRKIGLEYWQRSSHPPQSEPSAAQMICSTTASCASCLHSYIFSFKCAWNGCSGLYNTYTLQMWGGAAGTAAIQLLHCSPPSLQLRTQALDVVLGILVLTFLIFFLFWHSLSFYYPEFNQFSEYCWLKDLMDLYCRHWVLVLQYTFFS